MTVFELLGISQGDAIIADNPWSDYGEREMIPLALSKNGISIRAIDTRYGDIRYISSEWAITMQNGDKVYLKDIPYISEKLDEWNKDKSEAKEQQKLAQKQIKEAEIERELASLDELLSALKLENVKVAITGTLPAPRAKVKELLEEKGATVLGGVSKKLDLLIMGDTGKFEITSKMQKAHELGVKIVTVAQ
ncbi:anti-phage protein GapS2 [Vibrio porteresiae]|uniref:BRCT domain-containing protein n=1 Tax=Vibrio porteresiae DSM 19223 TaxID=1123496 RepID=A0ABZ0Q932_9VIBR|nr:BRCT domain-containing protein [Vibrio porteresiae]WPC72954.1 BRCT domain-containing protein [Vibrio porteresiae DSM 19223]